MTEGIRTKLRQIVAPEQDGPKEKTEKVGDATKTTTVLSPAEGRSMLGGDVRRVDRPAPQQRVGYRCLAAHAWSGEGAGAEIDTVSRLAEVVAEDGRPLAEIAAAAALPLKSLTRFLDGTIPSESQRQVLADALNLNVAEIWSDDRQEWKAPAEDPDPIKRVTGDAQPAPRRKLFRRDDPANVERREKKQKDDESVVAKQLADAIYKLDLAAARVAADAIARKQARR